LAVVVDPAANVRIVRPPDPSGLCRCDGEEPSVGLQFGRIDATLDKKARRRYRKNEGFGRLNPDSTLLEVARIHFQSARTIMIRDGFHAMMFVPLQGAMPVDLIVAPPRDRADKYMLVRDIARYVRRIGADGLLRIAETWIANREDIPRGGFAADAPNRTEALTLAAVNARGEQISLSAAIERKRIREHKVKRLGPTVIEKGDRMVSLAPVLEVWGKLDVLRLDAEDEYDSWASYHFGKDEEPKAEDP
jgi:hypothetical protein